MNDEICPICQLVISNSVIGKKCVLSIRLPLSSWERGPGGEVSR